MNKQLIKILVDDLRRAADLVDENPNLEQGQGTYVDLHKSGHCKLCAFGALMYLKNPQIIEWDYFDQHAGGMGGDYDPESYYGPQLDETYIRTDGKFETLFNFIVELNDDEILSYRQIADRLEEFVR